MNIEGKHSIELKHVGDGRVFLNFWDYAHGNDVICQIVDYKLILSQFDELGDPLPDIEITFAQFIERVNESILKRNLKNERKNKTTNQGIG